jgi:hypothetical protein
VTKHPATTKYPKYILGLLEDSIIGLFLSALTLSDVAHGDGDH